MFYRRPNASKLALLHMGITFGVSGDVQGTDRIFPFDVIPRIVEAGDFSCIERGLRQRIYALNEFIDDIYHDQKIVKDKVVPEFVIRSAAGRKVASQPRSPLGSPETARTEAR